MLLNDEWVNNDFSVEIRKFLETKENEPTTTQYLRDTVKAGLRGNFIAMTGLPKKGRNISNKQPNCTSTKTRGTTNKAQSK